jgi:photosystem II stability/assembly factor-like uncharacterized protein
MASATFDLFVATGDSLVVVGPRGARVELDGYGVRTVVLDGDTLWVGGRDGVWSSRDGATTWADGGLPRDVFSLAVGADGTVYAGCEPSALYRTRDQGATWHELEALQRIPSRPTWSFPPRPWTSHVRSIACSPHDPRVLLVGIELGGLMRSSDGGESWEDHAPGAQRDVHALAWHPVVAGRAYEAGGGGAAWSDDGGTTWRAADDGLDRYYAWALAVDPDDADTWFLSASTGPHAAHGGGHPQAAVFRRRKGRPWEALSAPAHSMPYALAFTSDRTLAVGLADGTIAASRDRGDTWQSLELRSGLPSRCVALAAT